MCEFVFVFVFVLVFVFVFVFVFMFVVWGMFYVVCRRAIYRLGVGVYFPFYLFIAGVSGDSPFEGYLCEVWWGYISSKWGRAG